MPNPTHSFHGQVSDSDRELILRQLAPLLAGCDAGIRLFGSRARGDAGNRSDIDLALICAEKPPADLLARIRETLEEASIPFRTDIVDYRSAPLELRQAIDREGIEWIA